MSHAFELYNVCLVKACLEVSNHYSVYIELLRTLNISNALVKTE